MSKRVALPGAIKAIREAKSKQAADAKHDPAKFIQARFAVLCLLTPGHLCNIEKGRKTVTEDVLHRIAAHLGVPVDAISYEAPSEAAA